MDRTPLDQILFEIDYHILSREVEIEIFREKVDDLQSAISIAKEKKDKADLEEALAMAKGTISSLKDEIAYFTHKRDIANWPKFKA